MKLGVLGGTFNPIHNAHLEMAALARDALGLDRVLLMVAGDPPHKAVDDAVDARTRFCMTELACRGMDRVEASDLELSRAGKSYTADTLFELHRLYPDAALTLVVGSDMLTELPSWYEPDTIARLAGIAYVPRVGEESGDAAAAERLRRELGARVRALPAGAEPLSSTAIRERVRAGLPVDGMLPMDALLYLTERGLYAPTEIQKLLPRLRAVLSEKRFRHTAGCVIAAARLAESWGVDPEKARLAATLHDCAKHEPPDQLFLLSGDDTDILAVQHAFAGAVLAKTLYGVTDDAVLRAIRRHCTGEKGMSLLDMCVYLADATEPTRAYPGAEELRAQLSKGPEAAMRAALDRSAAHVTQDGGAAGVHPATLRAIRYFQDKEKEDLH